MAEPTLTDYVHIMFTLFEMFEQQQQQAAGAKQGKPFTFSQKGMIVLFTLCQFRCIFHFKAQHRWLVAHPEVLTLLHLTSVPHRTTFSRRYKQLYQTLQAFVAFIGDPTRPNSIPL